MNKMDKGRNFTNYKHGIWGAIIYHLLGLLAYMCERPGILIFFIMLIVASLHHLRLVGDWAEYVVVFGLIILFAGGWGRTFDDIEDAARNINELSDRIRKDSNKYF